MIYVFDLDFTICLPAKRHDGTWDYLGAKPMVDRINYINELWNKGHTVIIETARGQSGDYEWHESTNKQLVGWGLKFHHLRVGNKFDADIYVDDKAVSASAFFEGKHSSLIGTESGGNSKVFLVERVYKEAASDKVQKLADEINYIESIPSKFKDLFPKIVLKNVQSSLAYYEMEHFKLPTLRRLILNEEITQKELEFWVRLTLSKLFELLNYQVIQTPDSFHYDLHFSRLHNRVQELTKKSAWFKEKLDEEYIIINGESFRNFYSLLSVLESKPFLESVMPEFVGKWSHSDLHFSNIIIDREKESVVFIDPRGYSFCDYYYDFGKMWHSVNGKYEMIATRQFVLNKDSFSFQNNSVYAFLESFKSPLMRIFAEFSNESSSTVEYKTEWNEVMHFASLIPFMFDGDGKDERAIASFYVATILANRFCDKYDIH